MADPNLAFFQTDVPEFRPMDPGFSGGILGWTVAEKQRLQNLGIPLQPRVQPGQPRGRLGTTARSLFGSTGLGGQFVQEYGRNPSFTEMLRGAPSGFSASQPTAGTSRQPVNLRALNADAARWQGQADRFAAGAGGGEVDWASILAALEGQRPGGGGVSVNRGLFNLSETADEQAMLAREMADIEARRSAGDVALRSAWGNIQTANAAAAEKARAMSEPLGDRAAGFWSEAAQQAKDLAAQRAQAAGQFEGRASIGVDPGAGASEWVSFMESQAPAERRFAERQQEILGSDLDWMAAMAGSQGEAYAGDLRRQANVLSFERAREHNLRVQDRINQERMMLAQMEQQAQSTNASLGAQRDQFDPFTQLNNMVGAAAVMGNPGLLAQQLGVSVPQAQQMVDNFLQGTKATVRAATPVR
jgi:hypothetical protein